MIKLPTTLKAALGLRAVMVIFCLLAAVIAYAHKDENTLVVNAGWFKPTHGSTLDTLRAVSYLPALVDTHGVFAADRPGVRFSNSTISLLVNPEGVYNYNFDVTLQGYYKRTSPTGPGLRDSTPFTLHVNYASGSGTTYKQRDAITVTSSVYTMVVARVTVNGFTIADTTDQHFRVELHTEADEIYNAASAEVPAFNIIKEDATARNILWDWAPLKWAEYYELEYVYIDDYKSDGTRRDRTSLKYNFRENAIRLRVSADEYEMPLVFEEGYVVARVRGVGFQAPNYTTPVYGSWSLSDAGTLPAGGNSVFEISPSRAHEADRLNWQYTSAFNESGLRSDAVSYADGTFRIRQQVGSSPEESKLLVSETFYDHQGKPAITVLPTPVKPAACALTPCPPANMSGSGSLAPGTYTIPQGTVNQFQQAGGPANLSGLNFNNTLITGLGTNYGLCPSVLNNLQNQIPGFELTGFLSLFDYRSQRARLGFVPRFNVTAEGHNILRNDFDGASSCHPSALIMGTQSGAGRYYSPANPEQARWQAYIADGEGYPYMQAKFTNDGSGKITESSMPGAETRIGNGHTKRYYYGTPSQTELDRLFGNDAGNASYYKKTLMIDENGQGHVSIYNLKGKLVVSALAGNKPENLEAITGAGQSAVTLDLIEENNILKATEHEWQSTKRLVLAAPGTVAVNYRTISPNLAGRYCTGANFCYDCVYDLVINITNDCGNTEYHLDTTIGRFNNFNSCEDFRISAVANLNLAQGSYLISKTLRVNEASVNAYVNNYIENFTCRADTLRFMPDIDASCSPDCVPCSMGVTSAVVLRRDGSNPSFYYAYRRTGNSSGCTLACTTRGLSDGLMAYQTMLNDVSPGGQYAEYRDTLTRTADNPLGNVNPAIFPLSVLNDGNQLPLQNANWRHPLFNYQTKTGEVAYVVISEDGLPLHRSPASEIVTRDGKQYVLPKYLNNVEDFIRLWEPQWAEALIAYHPEYEYYEWNQFHKASFSFDSLMTVTEKYSDAVSRSLTDYHTDPLFPSTATALRADMENRLANFSTSTGTTLSAAQVTIISVHCGNPNFNPTQFRDCYLTKTLFGTPGAQDKEWEIYKGLYRKTKLRVLANERNRMVTSVGGFNNRSIGGTRDVAPNILYTGKKRVFKEEDDVNDELGLDWTGDEPTVAEVEELRQRSQQQYYAQCGVCPTGTDLLTLFNSLNYEHKLTASSVALPGISPLVLTKNIVNSFSNSTALQYNWERIADPNPNILRFKITTGGTEMGTVQLQKSKTYLQWDSIFLFDCFQPGGEYTFTMRAIDNKDTTDIIQGRSSCFKMTGCTFPRSCTALPAERDMLVFLQYLFDSNRYKRTYLTVHTRTSYTPYFGSALSSEHAGGGSWQWNFAGFTDATNTGFNARFNIYPANTALTASPTPCDFSFRITSPGFTFDSVGFIISIRKPGGSLPAGRYVNDAELVVRSKGGRLFYIAMSNSCYQLFDCPASLANAERHPEMCCTPPPHRGVIVNDCESSLHFIARQETERDFYARRDHAADSIRAAYINHCLQSVNEVFTVGYTDGLYVATLYYYDQSGNLVKTVPPKGAHVLSDAQLENCRRYRAGTYAAAQIPAHTLATTYNYTSFKSIAEKTSPDEGNIKFSYDMAGRSLLSRNAVQAANTQASYTLYDANNRIIETGRTNLSGSWQTFRNYSAFTSSLTGKADVTLTNYDEANTAYSGYFTGGQKNLRNRPSIVRSQTNYGTDAYIIAYSYDAAGNVTRTMQYYPILALATRAQATKVTDYTFDRLNGKMLKVVYQPGQADQFIEWMNYDANKRITEVQTSTSDYTPERLRETDARFYYYQHGLPARVELGNEKIQGVDFAYTIQGWLKGINSYTTGNGNLDIGRDGTADGGLACGQFPKDAFAELLNYYGQDYKQISTEAADFTNPTASALNGGFSKDLYDGNIQNSITSVLHNFNGDTRRTMAQAYSYDQDYRLRQQKALFGTEAGFEAAFSGQYAMTLDYDLNGNISTLQRTGNSTGLFDNLTYHYNAPDNNNRLDYLSDVGVNGTGDLRNQTAGNYSYDAIGRLTADVSENLSSIQYNNQSKVSAVNKAGATITYAYDAFGRRISKTTNGQTEWYVNDAMGNPLAAYNINGSQVRWEEADIYAGKRVGVYKPNAVLNARDLLRDSLLRGTKRYELADHIGNVLAVVSDRKVSGADGATADVLAANNYYPFGMPMPGRSYGNDEYRYGYQGMESVDDLCGENNSYTTEFRQYDARVGRWLSIDPKPNPSESPYVAFSNNPISIADPKGDTVLSQRGYEAMRTDVISDLRGSDFSFDADMRTQQSLVTSIGHSSTTLSLIGPAREGYDPLEESRRIERNRLRDLVEQLATVTDRIEHRIRSEIESRLGDEFTVNPYADPMTPAELRSWLQIEEMSSRYWAPIIAAERRAELDAVSGNGLGRGSGNPFSGLIFAACVNSGMPRTEALRRTQAFNNVWDIGSGAVGLSRYGGNGGSEFEGEDRSFGHSDINQHIDREAEIRIGTGGSSPF